MKTKYLVIQISIILLITNCYKPKNLYVTADDYLSLREEPNLSSKVIMTLPRGTFVKSLGEEDNQITISQKNGKWTKISVNDTTGWVFGGFLSEDRPPEKPSLPPLPITLTYRDSILGKGYVLILSNQSSHYLQVNAIFHNPTFDQTSSFIIDIPAHGSTEFGWREGWTFSHGETIKIEHAEYLPLTSKL